MSFSRVTFTHSPRSCSEHLRVLLLRQANGFFLGASTVLSCSIVMDIIPPLADNVKTHFPLSQAIILHKVRALTQIVAPARNRTKGFPFTRTSVSLILPTSEGIRSTARFHRIGSHPAQILTCFVQNMSSHGGTISEAPAGRWPHRSDTTHSAPASRPAPGWPGPDDPACCCPPVAWRPRGGT